VSRKTHEIREGEAGECPIRSNGLRRHHRRLGIVNRSRQADEPNLARGDRNLERAWLVRIDADLEDGDVARAIAVALALGGVGHLPELQKIGGGQKLV
jgi:hypothetical protein